MKSIKMDDLQKELMLLKQKLKEERKKNRLLRKENKQILEKVKTYPCCKHIHKRGLSLESPINPNKHNLPEEGSPGHAFCQSCDSLKPLYFGEITNTEMHTKCVYICTKCCSPDDPCSFGPEFKILCEICLVKRKKAKEKNEAKKRKRESQEWYRIQKQNEDHNNRLLMQYVPKRHKKEPERESNKIYATDPRFRAYSPLTFK